MIRIREALDDDFDSVMALLAELEEVMESHHEAGPAGRRDVFGAMLSNPDIYVQFIALDGGETAGYLSMVFYKTLLHQGGTALINELVVNAVHRGKGIGARLLMKADEAARLRGMDEIEVGTEKTNTAAAVFYRKNGFDEEYVLLGKDFARRRPD